MKRFTGLWGAKFLAVSLLVASTAAWAEGMADTPPPCAASYGDPPAALEVNNQQVLHWMRTTPNQYRDRARVSGQVVDVYPDKNGHEHFAIQIGKREEDTIEIIYNQSFGGTGEIRAGMQVEACGDYITSIAPSGPYPASPDGALVHWVHRSRNETQHPHGYLLIDGKLVGMDAEHAGPKPPRENRGKKGRKGRGRR